MKIRPYHSEDLASVADLFTASVHGLTAEFYDAVQRAAWAPRPPDLAEWGERLSGLRTLVAEVDGELAGFLSYEMDGHIDLLYVAPRSSRRGAAAALLREAEGVLAAAGVSELFTEASLAARAFFESQGFFVQAEQTVERRGVAFRRCAMRKRMRVE